MIVLMLQFIELKAAFTPRLTDRYLIERGGQHYKKKNLNLLNVIGECRRIVSVGNCFAKRSLFEFQKTNLIISGEMGANF